MNDQVFTNISKIIERDSKSTTYKYALLRGVIDIIQDNSPYITFSSDRVVVPIGLLIEKWLLYYYPILESSQNFPQIHGETNLAFEKLFRDLIEEYRGKNGLSGFYNDLKNKGIPVNIQNLFYDLAKKLRQTITTMPMKHIGQSVNNQLYSIFDYENARVNRPSQIDLNFVIDNFGTFSFPKEYYQAFKVLGSFINGQDSILFKWAEFTVNASSKKLSVNQVLNEVL